MEKIVINGIELVEISEHPNYYVSKCGNIYSTYTNKFLKQLDNGRGYLRVPLRIFVNGIFVKSKNKRVHRLVAETFIPKVKDKTEVNHIDGNKSNNNVSNLEWCNRLENVNHGFSSGLYVHMYRRNIKILDTKTNFIYNSLKDACLSNGMNRHTLSDKLSGKIYNNTNLVYYKK